MKVIIDNGHGCTTVGKCSPDRLLKEWEWTRDVARRIRALLLQWGIDAVLLVDSPDDVPLRQRVMMANAMARKEPCLLVSVHADAAGSDGQWHQARGWSVFVAQNASQASIELARSLRNQAHAHGLTVRQPTPQQPYWVKSLAICRDTVCPAVLTENLFMDNPDDCRWMLTEQGKDSIARIHAEGVAAML